jgi:retron-type reverse transcriptase
MLSNVLLYEFDRRVAEYCKPIDVTYTRYADDLTFSTNRKNVLGDVEGKIDDICSKLPYPRLQFNREKRVHASKAASRRVTGLVLSNDGSVSLGHQRKRNLHAAVHHFKHGKLTANETKALAGMVAFVHSVEPKFLGSLARKYGKTVMQRLLGANQPPAKGLT